MLSVSLNKVHCVVFLNYYKLNRTENVFKIKVHYQDIANSSLRSKKNITIANILVFEYQLFYTYMGINIFPRKCFLAQLIDNLN